MMFSPVRRLRLSVLIRDSQGKLEYMERYEQMIKSSFQKSRVGKSGLQALPEAAHAYVGIAEEPLSQPPVSLRGCQSRHSGPAKKKRMARSGHAKRLEPESP